MNRNYQKELDRLTDQLAAAGKVPRLLLHSCCAPCSSYCLEYLSAHFEVIVFYYNPNIYPPEEFDKRVLEQQRLIAALTPQNPITLHVIDFHPEEFYQAVKGLEKEPEGGRRCDQCFELRLRQAAVAAQTLKCDYFTTTLSISPMKNSSKLMEIGEALAVEYEVPYLPSDFKKRGGYQRSVQMSKEYDLYRQDYCGCIFSVRDTDIA